MLSREDRVRRQRIWNRASKLVADAVRAGVLDRPSVCQRCGLSNRIEAAHVDYHRPLDVRWLCQSCHRKWDAAEPKTHGDPEPLVASGRLPRRVNTRLVAVLESQGRRIDWFAAQMGVSRWAFWRFETGRCAPPEDWYERAAVVLGVTPEEIAPEEQIAA